MPDLNIFVDQKLPNSSLHYWEKSARRALTSRTALPGGTWRRSRFLWGSVWLRSSSSRMSFLISVLRGLNCGREEVLLGLRLFSDLKELLLIRVDWRSQPLMACRFLLWSWPQSCWHWCFEVRNQSSMQWVVFPHCKNFLVQLLEVWSLQITERSHPSSGYMVVL